MYGVRVNSSASKLKPGTSAVPHESVQGPTPQGIFMNDSGIPSKFADDTLEGKDAIHGDNDTINTSL